ncbi:hypothetical protein [Campylobacter helveticus]|uniref:hypothetical protein n=1 Tax=Campylobacter helveticus TaxID=28898 RepID=UPI0022EA9794|nr:hypothetical protein [Campylobacter helveticus]
MKKLVGSIILLSCLFNIALAKITVSQQPIVQPHYEGCVLVYQYGADYSKCNNQGIYQNAFQGALCHFWGTC